LRHGQAVVGVRVSTLVGQMVRSGRVASTNRTLLKMALENVASTERVFAQMAHVRPVTGVCGNVRNASKRNETMHTHVAEDGASSVSRANTSCYNAGTETFHPHPLSESCSLQPDHHLARVGLVCPAR
jgi:hypothetical protein